MQQTLTSIDWYVDWLIENTGADATFEVETPSEKGFPDGLRLRGRADCVIHEGDGIHILDHKTRYSGTHRAMRDGEDIQLTAYAHESIQRSLSQLWEQAMRITPQCF